jgi:hypothetical protein
MKEGGLDKLRAAAAEMKGVRNRGWSKQANLLRSPTLRMVLAVELMASWMASSVGFMLTLGTWRESRWQQRA